MVTFYEDIEQPNQDAVIVKQITAGFDQAPVDELSDIERGIADILTEHNKLRIVDVPIDDESSYEVYEVVQQQQQQN